VSRVRFALGVGLALLVFAAQAAAIGAALNGWMLIALR
jgi:hypothetical protein